MSNIKTKQRLFEVEKILQKKQDSEGTKYLVHWKGFDESERTWEPYKNLKSVQDMVNKFNREEKKRKLKPKFRIGKRILRKQEKMIQKIKEISKSNSKKQDSNSQAQQQTNQTKSDSCLKTMQNIKEEFNESESDSILIIKINNPQNQNILKEIRDKVKIEQCVQKSSKIDQCVQTQPMFQESKMIQTEDIQIQQQDSMDKFFDFSTTRRHHFIRNFQQKIGKSFEDLESELEKYIEQEIWKMRESSEQIILYLGMHNKLDLNKIYKSIKIKGCTHYDVKFNNGFRTTLSQNVMETYYKDDLYNFFLEQNR